jgi:hypothetical protein
MSLRRNSFRALVLLPLVAGLAPVACGCTYISNRAKDFSDVIAVGGSTGGGVMVRAGASKLLSLNVGAQSDARFYGFRRRYCQWGASSYGLGFASFWSPTFRGDAPEDWNGSFIFRTSQRKVGFLQPLSAEPEEPLPNAVTSRFALPLPATVDEEMWRYYLFLLMKAENGRLIEVLDVEIGAGALIGGFEVILSPGQVLDFVAGIFCIDLAGDDA